MITVEISPELAPPGSNLMLDMTSEVQDNDWESTQVQTSASGELLGTARQRQNPSHVVRFFQGKGGFCAVVSNDRVVYFGLPGSRIVLPDTEVNLPGEPITGKPADMISRPGNTPPQQVGQQAMILGAGLATRFEPVSGDTTGFPKPGVPLVGQTAVITAIAQHLKRHGFTKLLINTCYKPDAMKRQLQGLDGMEIHYIDEETPSGTAGGLVKALQQRLVDTSQPLMIIQGDAITDADMSFLMNTHRDRHAAVTIGGQIVPDRDVNKFGIIETDATGGDGQSGNITSFKEKPSLAEAGPSRFGNAGFYILSPEVLPLFQAAGERRLRAGEIYDYAQNFFPEVLDAVKASAIQEQATGNPMGFWAQAVGGYWSDMGNPVQYIEAVRDAYAGRFDIQLPEKITDYYENGIIYWPGAHSIARAEQAELTGNVIVALTPDAMPGRR